jgi:hypothetical protein
MSVWELNDVEQKIRAVIAAAAGHSRVYQSMRAARGASSWFVVFRKWNRLPDVNAQGVGNRILSRPTYDVEVVTKGAPTDASEAGITSIEAALGSLKSTAGSFQIVGERIDSISRESPGATAEEYYVHRGGTYQFWVS